MHDGRGSGAVVGLLAGGKNKGTAAVVGAVAACGVAMGANYYLDVRRGQYQNTSDQLKAMGDDIKTDTQKVQARSNSIKAVMADDKRKLEMLQSDITAKTGDQAAAKRELAQIDANIGVIKKDLSNMKNVADQYRQAGAQTRGSAKTREMQQQLAALETKIAQLNKEADSYFALRSAIDLGEQKA